MLLSSPPNARLQIASDQSLLVSFGGQTSLAVHEHVRRFVRFLELEPISGIRNLHPAYCSVLVKFDPLKLRHEALEETLRASIGRM